MGTVKGKLLSGWLPIREGLCLSLPINKRKVELCIKSQLCYCLAGFYWPWETVGRRYWNSSKALYFTRFTLFYKAKQICSAAG
jgi:hypothetical protein